MRKRAPSAGGFTAIGAGLLDAERSQAAISPEAAVSNAGHKKPNAGAPFISGDFAAIEAGLLGSRQEKAAAIVSEATVSNTFPKVDLGSERWLNEDNTPVFRHGGIAGGHKRSRRAFYAMAAIAAAGMAGIAASFGFWSGVSAPPEVPTITAEDERSCKQKQRGVWTLGPGTPPFPASRQDHRQRLSSMDRTIPRLAASRGENAARS